jgi:hypothetical protein
VTTRRSGILPPLPTSEPEFRCWRKCRGAGRTLARWISRRSTLSSASTLLAPPAGLVEVVLDTDVTNEIDDQFALAWALLRPDRLRVRALHAAPYSHATHLVQDPALVTDLERQHIDELVAEYADVMVLDPADGVDKAERECRVIAELCGVDVPVVAGCRSFLPRARGPGGAVDT